MRFFQVQRPKNQRGCWAADWGHVWHILTAGWIETERKNCRNYARTGHLTCLQHKWREGAAWDEAKRLAQEESK
jgi:hypothetical protein